MLMIMITIMIMIMIMIMTVIVIVIMLGRCAYSISRAPPSFRPWAGPQCHTNSLGSALFPPPFGGLFLKALLLA